MDLLAYLLDGLLIGFVYGVAAMGLTLIWGVMRVVNLAHGAFIALGSFGVYLLFSKTGMNPYLALLPVAAAGLLFGMLVYAVVIHRVIDAPELSSLLATYAVHMIVIGLGTAAFSTTPRTVDFSLGSLSAGPVTVSGTRLVAALASLAVAAALTLFLTRTRPGKHVRAVANNKAAAELMGIAAPRVLALAFGIGTMLAAIAGGLIATFFPFTILSGGAYEVKSFVVAVLGGLGNPLGALAGGLVLGALEGVIPAWLPTSWVPVVEFLLFVGILVVKPTGLMGGKR